VSHEHREELVRVRLAGIGADAVAVPGQLGEALSGLVGRHRSVVDLAADRPGGYSPGYTPPKSAFIYATVLEGGVPLGEARLGRIGFDEWLRRSQAAPDPASANRRRAPSATAGRVSRLKTSRASSVDSSAPRQNRPAAKARPGLACRSSNGSSNCTEDASLPTAAGQGKAQSSQLPCQRISGLSGPRRVTDGHRG